MIKPLSAKEVQPHKDWRNGPGDNVIGATAGICASYG